MIDFKRRLSNVKKQWWRQQLLLALIFGLCAYTATLLIATGASLFVAKYAVLGGFGAAVTIGILAFFLCLLVRRFSHSYSSITLNNLLLHIDRAIPITEESAYLLIAESAQLNGLQRLQKQRVENSFVAHEQEINTALDALYSIKRRTQFFVLMLAVALVSSTLFTITQKHTLPISIMESPFSISDTERPVEISWEVIVTPPEYTGLSPWGSTQLDIEAPQDSKVQWIANTTKEVELTLQIPRQPALPFSYQNENRYSVEWVLAASTLYSFGGLSTEGAPDIHTLSMIRDKAPSIQIMQPLATVTEFTKSEKPIVDIEVLVNDDYALSDYYLSVSIAKGTGEAVKFRDAEYRFDADTPMTSDVGGIQRRLTKRWDFWALEMEPGDELYFSVIAADNRYPEPQTTQSNTKILKWLDDDETGITSDGILIDFIPEYFKSQRQIIIETIELIDRQPLLTAEEFEQTSRDLALSQSDLKQRYGQYLGDEFESGIMQTMESGPDLPEAEDHEHEHDHAHDKAQERNGGSAIGHEHGHNHGHGNDGFNEPSLSGYDEIIDQFGHNHGEADAGFMIPKQGQLNPKALMKQSIANMWQAELFLHLADPRNALPYEQKALDYLNRARKAERVYVKRLGFKPPPVSEERRYEGDLSDILEPKRVQEKVIDLSFEQQIQQLLSRLSHLGVVKTSLSDQDTLLVEQVTAGLAAELAQTDDNQQTLQIMSILERITLTQQWLLDDCSQCIDTLIIYFWQRLPQPVSVPTLSSLGNRPLREQL